MVEEFQLGILNKLAEQCIKRLGQEFPDSGTFSDELLLSMHELFGITFERALQLAEKNILTILETRIGQRIWKVKSYSDSWIYLLPHVNFCKCEAYKLQVMKFRTAYSCKHFLAAEINFARNLYEIQEIKNEEMSQILNDIYIKTVIVQ